MAARTSGKEQIFLKLKNAMKAQDARTVSWRDPEAAWERFAAGRATVREMRQLCHARGLPTEGSISRLQWRLQRQIPPWTDPVIPRVALPPVSSCCDASLLLVGLPFDVLQHVLSFASTSDLLHQIQLVNRYVCVSARRVLLKRAIALFGTNVGSIPALIFYERIFVLT